MKTLHTHILWASLFNCILLPLGHAEDIDLSTHLMLHLPCNGNAQDESGHNRHGIVTGASLTDDRHGTPDSAYLFNGSSYISIDTEDIFLNTNGFTISFWVQPAETQTERAAPMLSYGYGRNGGLNMAFWREYGMFVTTLYDYSWSGDYVATDEWDDLIWYMYTFTYDGHVLREYVNGILIDQKGGTYHPTTSEGSYSLRLGTDSASATKFFRGSLDDIRIYSRVLTEREVAHLSALSGAIRATELNAYSLTDFEFGTLLPAKFSNFWAVWGNNGNAYSEVVENPLKSGANTSDFVCVSHTFPSLPLPDQTDCDKSEYVLTTATGEGLVTDRHHILKWKLLLTDDTLLNIDDVVWDWMSFNQIHQGAEKYPPPGQTGPEDETIAEGGGIYNDCVKARETDPSIYRFRYRAIPDQAVIPFKVDIGQWMSFTYEILWTQSNTGFWRLWKDGELLSSADNVKTLPDSYTDPEDDYLQFKTGLYNKWNDPEIERLSLYFDDLELYIGEEIRVEDVSPECIPPAVHSFLTCALVDNEISIIGCSQSASGILLLPTSIDGCAVSSIDDQVFASCTDLTGLVIPSTITNIGASVFQACSSLQTIIFQGNAPSIGPDPFAELPDTFTLYYPEGATGFSSSPWTALTPIIVPPADPLECRMHLSMQTNQTSLLTIAPTIPGRTYQLQSNVSLISSWLNAGSLHIGDGNNLIQELPMGTNSTTRFFRIRLDPTAP